MSQMVSVIQSNSIQNGVFVVNFSLFNKQISPFLSQLITDFGEPTLTVGGTYTPGGSVPVFTVPVQSIKLISGLPVQFLFDPTNTAFSPAYIQAQATYFATQFEAAFDAAVTTLIANSDTFTGQTILNFPS